MNNLGLLKVGFVGAGRVGCGLAKALNDAGCWIYAASSRSMASTEALAGYTKGCAAVENAQMVADECDLVFITTPDDAIESVAQSVDWRRCGRVVHCSGATEVSVLATSDQVQIGGFHPMQSFTDPVAAAASLAGCTVTIEADETFEGLLEGLAEALGCPVNRLLPGKRALYHAAAGYGSQFINVLLEETAAIWRGWGASDEDVVRAILPMIRGTLGSIESAGIAGGMPGPVSRGDVATVEKHAAALLELDGGAFEFYAAHCQRTVTLAEKAGRIDPNTAAKLRTVLEG